jgi:RNA polymerase sigma-70 factor (ECF subfamily)
MLTLSEIRSGGRQEREAFVEASYADLFRWFHWLTNDVDLAADLVQGTFLAFWESVGPGQATVEARRWLFGIGRNVWRNHCRQKQRSPPTAVGTFENDALHPTTKDDNTVESASAAESASEIRAAVAEMPIEIGEAVTLRYWQDWSYAEIAKLLEISEVSARQRVLQGREWLRRRLKKLAPRAPEPGRPDQPVTEGINR